MSKAIGDLGEDLAADFLQKKGYSVIERNFRFKRAEIDIIAEKEDTLVFVEVKLRKSLSHGHPEDSVDNAKMRLYTDAAEHYLEIINWNREIRFDIISITGDIHKELQTMAIKHLQDVFYPTEDN